jgi:deoxyhypusine monooxygenase
MESERAEAVLLSAEAPLAERFEALFALEGRGTAHDAEVVERALASTSSNLLRHELAYALGQMQHKCSVCCLSSLLGDPSEAGIVRHEAAEALGAIASESAEKSLRTHLHSDVPEVAQTCELALARIAARRHVDRRHDCDGQDGVKGEHGSLKEQKASQSANANGESPFLSVDPVPAWPVATPQASLQKTVLDESRAMWDRYGALFALRNKGDVESAAVLTKVLRQSRSALLKHEVAYVLGQLQCTESGALKALEQSLRDTEEHPMVRHEAAEAVGSVCTTASAKELLQEMASNASEPVVSESCEVAIEMMESEK